VLRQFAKTPTAEGEFVLKDFRYAAPTSVAEAAKLLAGANGSAKILAGGTDILVQLREG
jgi:carbon-monoxide dehydrogenase medium subunit